MKVVDGKIVTKEDDLVLDLRCKEHQRVYENLSVLLHEKIKENTALRLQIREAARRGFCAGIHACEDYIDSYYSGVVTEADADRHVNCIEQEVLNGTTGR
jgi:hypothetical protein